MNERAAKASRAEEVRAASQEEVTSIVAASSAGDVGQLAAIVSRPSWSADPADAPRLRCQWEGCDLEAVACVVALKECYCRRHARAFRQEHPERRIVALVDCTRCRRQGPVGLALAFEGENTRKLCRDCAELVRAIVEGEK